MKFHQEGTNKRRVSMPSTAQWHGSPSLTRGKEKGAHGAEDHVAITKGNAEGAQRAPTMPPDPKTASYAQYVQLDNIWNLFLPGTKVLVQLAWPTNRIPGIEPPRPWAKHRFPIGDYSWPPDR